MIMPFRRRMSGLRPIHSIKHIVDSQGGIVAATKTKVTLAHAVDAPVLANTTEVETGSRITSMFVNIQVIGTGAGGVLNNIYAIFYKNPGGNIAGGSVPNGNVTGADDFKRQIFHTEMLMLSSSSDDIPQALFKGVLRIPRVFHNMRINDDIELQLFAPGDTSNYCVQCIYKEYR